MRCYARISVPSLNVTRTSSLLQTVTKSTRLTQSIGSNSVTMPSIACSSFRKSSIVACRLALSLITAVTSSRRAFAFPKRSVSPSQRFWYSVWSRATWGQCQYTFANSPQGLLCLYAAFASTLWIDCLLRYACDVDQSSVYSIMYMIFPHLVRQ